jgi:hypothetical protein
VTSLLDADAIVFPDHPNTRVISRMADAVVHFPLDAIMRLDAWYQDFCGTDIKLPIDPATVEATMQSWREELHGDQYMEVLFPRLKAAADTAMAWKALRDGMAVSGADGILGPPTAVGPDGKERRLFAPEGAALEAFLQHADTQRWYTREGVVVVEVSDSAVACLKPVAEAITDVALTVSPCVADYLASHPGMLEGLVDTVTSGSHTRCPVIGLDTTRIVFQDCVARLTCMGIERDPAGSAAINREAPVAARACVPAEFGCQGIVRVDTEAAVLRMFGNHAFALRVCGALLLPPPLRGGDKWKFIVVATPGSGGGGVGGDSVHPVETMCRSFIGFGVTEHLKVGDPVTSTYGNSTTSPYCLFVRCPTGVLTHTQLTQVDMALGMGLAVVVVAPHVPEAISQNPQLRLLSVQVDVPPSPLSDAIIHAALPHVLPVCLAAYNSCGRAKLNLQTPLYDPASLAGRVNSTALGSASHLLAEMLQAEFGVRHASRKTVDLKEVQGAFRKYQELRGFAGVTSKDITATDVSDAYALVATLNPPLRAEPAQWNSHTKKFLNLAAVPTP